MSTVAVWILVAVSAARVGVISTPAPTFSEPLTKEGCEALLEATKEVVLTADRNARMPAMKCVQVTIPSSAPPKAATNKRS